MELLACDAISYASQLKVHNTELQGTVLEYSRTIQELTAEKLKAEGRWNALGVFGTSTNPQDNLIQHFRLLLAGGAFRASICAWNSERVTKGDWENCVKRFKPIAIPVFVFGGVFLKHCPKDFSVIKGLNRMDLGH